MSLLVAHNLDLRLSASYRLEGVSFDLEPGELVFLLGPSGSGKSTLLRLIAGFLTPDDGEITFEGVNITHVPAHQRGIVMMFQNYALWPHLTVAEHVAFGLEMRGVAKEEQIRRVAETLELVGLHELAFRFPHQLSGGQQQRVALARALVVRPKVLLLDEPLANLDSALRQSIGEELLELQRRFSCAMLYVTHDADEALRHGQRIIVMDAGQVAQTGTPTELYTHPNSPLVAKLLGETNVLESSPVLVKALDTNLPARFALRPESLSLNGAAETQLEATLIKREYLGSRERLHARLADNQIISFYTPCTPQPLRLDAQIKIGVARADLIPFP